jgi:ribonuclease P protein component
VPSQAQQYGRLRRRPEFLAAAKGLRVNAPTFSLQAIRRPEPGNARFGFTVTSRTGNAVERARMRRRLKEAIRTKEALPVRDGHDYVFVARRSALNTPFAELCSQIARALAEIGAKADRKSHEPKRTGTDEVPMKAADRR